MERQLSQRDPQTAETKPLIYRHIALVYCRKRRTKGDVIEGWE